MPYGGLSSRQTGVGSQSAVLLLVVLLFSGAIAARLAWLQLLHGPEYRPWPMKIAFA